jgi:hypothetical protein
LYLRLPDDYCGAVLDPQHGSVWTTDRSRINSTATFKCNNGYRMEGPGTRVCSGNTNWEPVQDTKCIIKGKMLKHIDEWSYKSYCLQSILMMGINFIHTIPVNCFVSPWQLLLFRIFGS